jgi:hypothetical protein
MRRTKEVVLAANSVLIEHRSVVESPRLEIFSTMLGLRLGTSLMCCVIGVNAASAQSAASAQIDDREVAAKKYEVYKAKVMAADLNINWRDFRLSAYLGQVSQGFDSWPVHVQIVEDLAAGRYEKALAESQTVIDHNMASGEGHLLAMTVLQKMGRTEDAKKQEAILNAIGKSIMDSGDGNSAKTAWFTVAPSETVFFMTEALGAQIKGQELVHVNGHAYDKLTVIDRQGETRIVWFNTDTNELVKERGLHPSLPASTQENELITAAGKDDLSRVKALLDNGTDVKVKTEHGGTALMRASFYGYLDVVQILLSSGAEINAKTNDGRTALMYASLNGHLDVVQALLAKGADVNVKETEDGESALMVSSQNGHLEVVRALLNKSPDVNATDNKGWTALMWASFNGYVEIVEALVAKGADVNAQNSTGGTALAVATHGKRDEVRAYLMQAGAKP